MAILIDSHVHFHSCFNPVAFFNSALQNFSKILPTQSIDNLDKILLFTESQGSNYFEQLSITSSDFNNSATWKMCKTYETSSLIARDVSGKTLIVIAGRQIVTSEKLEVLALGLTDTIPDGSTLSQTVRLAQEQGAIVVLPWGFGKWAGQRGVIIDDYLSGLKKGEKVFLGDNGNRLEHSITPKQFSFAAKNGIFILPGSDPLPFVSQQKRVASYGFILPGRIDENVPKQSLCTKLLELSSQPDLFGQKERFSSFVYYQVAMQLRKRLLFGKGRK